MHYDILVIGSGPGGYVAAIRAAQLGKQVALVERDAVGGVCLNRGCIPTKALIRSAHLYQDVKAAAQYGVTIAGEVSPNLEAMVNRSRTVAETMSKGVQFLLKKNNITLITGTARIAAHNTVEVEGEQYTADHIILATGARPRVMP
ncbi:MAG: FAD-dependent oxidoreductase, partial [Alistipes sp.]|nr:FAD-dependent oxidoreductase [Alistipes sp.]